MWWPITIGQYFNPSLFSVFYLVIFIYMYVIATFRIKSIYRFNVYKLRVQALRTGTASISICLKLMYSHTPQNKFSVANSKTIRFICGRQCETMNLISATNGVFVINVTVKVIFFDFLHLQYQLQAYFEDHVFGHPFFDF